MENFFDKLVSLKDDAIDFIQNKVAPNGISGGITVNIDPQPDFRITRIESDSSGIYVSLNREPIDICNLSREKIIMIASYLDGSWDGL